MAKKLLIVESPAKARTINKYLGSDFKVLASYGHVRDLRPREGAVDTEHHFAMRYEPIERNEKHVDAIARAAKGAEIIYLATDRDREGEAISWHIHEILEERDLLDGKPVHRVVFSEITRKAIRAAIDDPHSLSQNLVDAQQARRALDYLVGFNLSPVLWRKVQAGLSAGRVQSPALRMIVEREEEIEAFEPREYWSIEADLAHPKSAFKARLVRLDEKKFEQFDLTNAGDAHAVRERLLAAAGGRLEVGKITRRERKRRPAPPFITSTLQQDAARKLGFSTSRTMRVAQSLYEGVALGNEGNAGLITYMRTDSTALAEEALSEMRRLIRDDYGERALPGSAQRYKAQSRNAQEAHEAIRPTSAFRRPKQIAGWLGNDQRRLYELVWKRAVASQMRPATLNTVSADLPLEDAAFRASGTSVVDPGFLAVYEEGRETQKNAGEDNGKKRLPALETGEKVALRDILAAQHFTEPPPRYSEARLVKTMEEHGIGRPSTYASIISVLLKRKYVVLENRRFKPTDVGRTVGKFLTDYFERYVDYEFTARLEEELDEVSHGRESWIPLLERFWQPFKEQVENILETTIEPRPGTRVLGTDPESGKPVSVKLGRYGPFAQIGTREDEKKPRFASLAAGYDLHTVTLEEALKLFELPRALGQADDGETISAGIGRFGPFVRKGRVYASLKKDDDPFTVGLARAKELIEGKLEYLRNRIIRDFGDGIQILRGRFGPYITDGNKNARVPKEREPDSLGRDECAQLLAQAPERRKRGKKKTAKKKTRSKKAAGKKPAARKKKAGGRKRATGTRKKKPGARKRASSTDDTPA